MFKGSIWRFGDSSHASATPGKSVVLRLLTGGLLVRVQPEEPIPLRGVGSRAVPSSLALSRFALARKRTSQPEEPINLWSIRFEPDGTTSWKSQR